MEKRFSQMYRYIIQITWIQYWRDIFRLLANCFRLFCSDLDVFINPSLLADIQKPNWKSVQDPWGGGIQLFNLSPLYCFTLFNLLFDSILSIWILKIVLQKRIFLHRLNNMWCKLLRVLLQNVKRDMQIGNKEFNQLYSLPDLLFN